MVPIPDAYTAHRPAERTASGVFVRRRRRALPSGEIAPTTDAGAALSGPAFLCSPKKTGEAGVCAVGRGWCADVFTLAGAQDGRPASQGRKASRPIAPRLGRSPLRHSPPSHALRSTTDFRVEYSPRRLGVRELCGDDAGPCPLRVLDVEPHLVAPHVPVDVSVPDRGRALRQSGVSVRSGPTNCSAGGGDPRARDETPRGRPRRRGTLRERVPARGGRSSGPGGGVASAGGRLPRRVGLDAGRRRSVGIAGRTVRTPKYRSVRTYTTDRRRPLGSPGEQPPSNGRSDEGCLPCSAPRAGSWRAGLPSARVTAPPGGAAHRGHGATRPRC